MVLFLIPVAVVGYKVWEHQQKRYQTVEQNEDEAAGQNARVVDNLPCDDDGSSKEPHKTNEIVSDETAEITSFATDNIDSMTSSDDDDQTGSEEGEEGQGPLLGLRKYLEDKREERRARELQKQRNLELAMKIASGQGTVALPKISYK